MTASDEAARAIVRGPHRGFATPFGNGNGFICCTYHIQSYGGLRFFLWGEIGYQQANKGASGKRYHYQSLFHLTQPTHA